MWSKKLKLAVDLNTIPAELRDGLAAVVASRPKDLSGGAGVSFANEPSLCGLRVTQSLGSLQVTYGRKSDAFRAVGRLLGMENVGSFEEICKFDTLGVMIDCSRNGVMTVAAVKDFLLRSSLMGINMMHLYCEDTYEVPGEPFFGYLRGGYTHDEMKEIDDQAFALGIEVIPCIQTLSHLDQILQWPPYRELEDMPGVILTGDHRTYALMDKMITAASAPVRSRRINLGMDEAFEMGEGKYRQIHGERPKIDVLNEHIARLKEICESKGLRPMIWGDMHFVLSSPDKDYYDRNISLAADFGERIPKGVDFVFWDYYHQNIDIYLEWIDRYRAIGLEPIFSCSGWTHVRLVAALPWAFKTISLGMEASRRKGVREAMISLWGDDGTEVDYYSALPAMQLFTEYGYADKVEMNNVESNFRGSCGCEMSGYVDASKVDYFDFRTDGGESFSNHSKWLLYQDLLLGLMDPQLEDFDLRNYYGKLAGKLEAASAEGGMASRLRYPALIAEALSLKTHLRRDLRAAYLAGDKAKLRELVDGDLTNLRQAVRDLWKCYRDMWLSTYKPLGLEVVEQRYGGLMARLETASDRLNSYLAGEILNVVELEHEPIRLFAQPVEHVWVPYRRVYTPSFIK